MTIGSVGPSGTHYGHNDCALTKWAANGSPAFGSAMVACTCPKREAYADSIYEPEVDQLSGALRVLDHGYIKLIEAWGSDERIVEAARMSTGKGFLGWGPNHSKSCRTDSARPCNCSLDGGPGDEKLLSYLWDHKHMTPFEMAGAVVEVQAPIFVFREWHRHRTQSYNELSSRYTPLPDVNYVPSVDRLMHSGGSSKQSQSIGGKALDMSAAQEFRGALIDMYRRQQELYERALAAGVPKELARVHLPVGRYSRMRASANLRNWLAFLTLREDSVAQWEIRQYAVAMHVLLARKFPRVLGLYEKDR